MEYPKMDKVGKLDRGLLLVETIPYPPGGDILKFHNSWKLSPYL